MDFWSSILLYLQEGEQDPCWLKAPKTKEKTPHISNMPSNFQRILIPPFFSVPEQPFISSLSEILGHKNEVKHVTTGNFFFFF